MADDHWMRDGDLAADREAPSLARAAGAVAALAVAAAAAATIPGARMGLQVPVLAAGTAAAVALCRERKLAPSDLVLSGLALALTAMTALRAAEWIVLIDLAAAAGLAAVVVTRAVRWREVFAAPLGVVGQVRSVPAFLFGGVARRVRAPALAPLVRGATIAMALAFVFGGLFASADPAFATLASSYLVPDVDLSTVPARVAVFAAALFAVGALARSARPAVAGSGSARTRLGTPEWVIALSALDLVFVAFVVVQLAVLFGGRTHVLETAGLGYAEYARQGFFQLLAVGALTLGVVAAAVRWAARDDESRVRLLQALLAVLCVCTLVILASAFRRLSLYESVFGYTRLRISVHATILWMAAVFAVVLVAGIRMRAPWLPRTVLIVTATALLGFTLLDPDRVIAERNVERYQATGSIDLAYLGGLSADAAPALARLPRPLAACAVEAVSAGLGEADGALGWNLGRSRARDLGARLGTCEEAGSGGGR